MVFHPCSESLKGDYFKECSPALETCLPKQLSLARGPFAGKQEVSLHPLQALGSGTNVAAGSCPSYGCSGISLWHIPVKQRHPRASAETETLPWCRHWCWAPPHQLDCSSSSQKKQSLAKVMRWSQAHYVNTVWATFIIPHHEPRLHERGSLAPLDNFNHF